MPRTRSHGSSEQLGFARTRCTAQIELVERELDSWRFDSDAAALLVGCLRAQ